MDQKIETTGALTVPRMTMSADIIVAGAGAAGTATAAVLGRQGLRVILIDPRSHCAPIFKAEKIVGANILLLRKLGLLGALVPSSGRVREVQFAYNGRVFRTTSLNEEEYSLRYEEIVNAFRKDLPSTVTFRTGHVQEITSGADIQRVKLLDGEDLTSRLIVLACGMSHKLQTSLGLRRRVIQKDQCVILGFMIAAGNGKPFAFDAMTYYPTTSADRIDYLTLFNFRQATRGNLFVFRPAGDSWIRRFLREPDRMLRQSFPKLERVIGAYHVAGPVETASVDHYAMDGDRPPGVVVIGDAFQSACPATGLGMIKLLTDVDVLSECVPSWLATHGMGADKLSGFYNHPRKRVMDADSIQAALYQRRAVLDDSLRWRLRRFRLRLKWRLESWKRNT